MLPDKTDRNEQDGIRRHHDDSLFSTPYSKTNGICSATNMIGTANDVAAMMRAKSKLPYSMPKTANPDTNAIIPKRTEKQYLLFTYVVRDIGVVNRNLGNSDWLSYPKEIAPVSWVYRRR